MAGPGRRDRRGDARADAARLHRRRSHRARPRLAGACDRRLRRDRPLVLSRRGAAGAGRPPAANLAAVDRLGDLRFDAPLVPVAGVMHRPQPPAAVAALGAAVAAVADPWRLLVLHEVATISGSLVLGLALLERHLGIDEVWRAAQLDEDFQIERWGEDPEA